MWALRCSRKLSVRLNSFPHTWQAVSCFFRDLSQLVYKRCRSKWYFRVKSLPQKLHENGLPEPWLNKWASRISLFGQVALQWIHAKCFSGECSKNKCRSKLIWDLNDFGQKLQLTWPYYNFKMRTEYKIRLILNGWVNKRKCTYMCRLFFFIATNTNDFIDGIVHINGGKIEFRFIVCGHSTFR